MDVLSNKVRKALGERVTTREGYRIAARLFRKWEVGMVDT